MKLLVTSVRASEGIAIGKAFVVARGNSCADYVQGSPEQEQQLFDAALAKSVEQITALAEGNDIFAAHLEMISDDMLRESVEAHIAEGSSAPCAVDMSCQELVAMFESMDDEYLAARAADIKDIFSRISQNLQGGVQNPFEGVCQGDIIIDKELLPSDMAMIDFSKIRGFVTAEGSSTSHVCIVARNLSVPAVVGLNDALCEIANGDTVIIDGFEGRVVVNPDAQTLDSYRAKELNIKIAADKQQLVAHNAVSYNGTPVLVLGNAGSVEEVERAIEAGADGIGLFRSEFLYMQSTVEPTEQQQYEAYRAAAEACGDKPLTIRTLDIGGDKAVPYLGFPKEENPFLGWRAIRVSLDCRDMFCRQLRAILRASACGNVRVMLPMVVCLDELREAKSLLEQCKAELENSAVPYDENIKVGVMIETPAAVFIADALAAECDFFSIGTNDLVQYVMAADRANVKVARLYDPYSTAVMTAIEQTIAAADRAHIECSMCGELAADSQATESLLKLNLRKFSVGASSVAKIKYTITKL